MRDVKNCEEIPYTGNESREATEMKRKLCGLGRALGYEVDVEEPPESELGDLGIRHDVLWCSQVPEWYTTLLGTAAARPDLDPEYRRLLESKRGRRWLYVAFEVEARDQTTKGMKGDISNLSKLPMGFVVVRRGSEKEDDVRKYEPIRNRFEKALSEFRKLHGPNNVVILSFSDIEQLLKIVNAGAKHLQA